MTPRLVAADHPIFAGIPRLLGFASVAAVTDATDYPLIASSVRGYYLKDLARGRWHLLPRPDAVLLRTEASPLPGWSPETIELWLPERRA